MLKTEKKYEFRQRLLEVHKPNVADPARKPEKEELVLSDGFTLYLPADAGVVALTAAKDFQDYLLTSMNLSALLLKGKTPQDNNCLCYRLDAAMEKGYRIHIGSRIEITANDERSLAQALYALEDRMNHRKAPFLKQGDSHCNILFSPRMLHSGFGWDEFPNEHLAAMAHAGRDAILVFTKGVNETPVGFHDFNELIYRAAKYGIDVYAYSYMKSLLHPEDEGAQEFYDGLYGTLFQKCPGLRGVVFVGESIGFPSKDEHTTRSLQGKGDIDGIPQAGKPNPGWWPCYDFPQWLEVVKKAIAKYRPDADLVFWTYNWSTAPKEDRLKLIRTLPQDISLLATFEAGEPRPCFDSTIGTDDYTIAFEGPGQYFASEAEAAKERGIRLYTMANTGGLTWDMGTIPYEPYPFQWMRRYQQLLNAHDNWGLCGLMESHHYGFWPSFIGQLSKRALTDDGRTMDEKCKEVLEEFFGEEHYDPVNRALACWSEAIRYYTHTDNDQYGAFRIGPAYPFNFLRQLMPIPEKHAVFGASIVWPVYPENNRKGRTLSMVKLADEIKSLETMLSLLEEGLAIFKTIPQAQCNDELLYLINMGEYMRCIVITGIHAKQWHGLKMQLKAEADRAAIATLTQKMEDLLHAEIANAENAIVFVERDSRLGWEPSMDYLGDADHIRWKIRQLEFEIQEELPMYSDGCKY